MKKIRVSTLFIILAVPFLLVTGVMMAKPRAPLGVPSCYKDIVCDTAQILNAEQRKQIEDIHRILLEQHDIDLRVLTSSITAAGTINFFRTADIGNKSDDGHGALFMVDPQTALVRFHTSPTIAEIYNAEFVAYIEGRQMMPFFKANKVSSGIVGTDKMIAQRAVDAKAGKAFDAADYQAFSGVTAPAAQNVTVPQVQRPAEIISEYLRMLVIKNSSYDLPVYSRASKKIRQGAPLTDAQMKTELSLRQVCEIYKEVILDEGFAAILYNIDQRQCPPYFLIFEDGAWRMDLSAMMKYIRLDETGYWYFDVRNPTVYSNTLLDWTFDANGMPHPMPKMRWGLLIDSDMDARVTYIKKIYDNTPAANMALREKDVILEWNGLKNPLHTDIQKNMSDSDGGQQIPVLLWRNGQRMTVTIEAPPRL